MDREFVLAIILSKTSTW